MKRILLVALILLAVNTYAQSAKLSFLGDNARIKYEEVTTWLNGLHSFCVDYTFTSYFVYRPDLNNDPDVPVVILDINYCYDGNRRYVSERDDALGIFQEGVFLNEEYIELRSIFRKTPETEQWEYYTWDKPAKAWEFPSPDFAIQSPSWVFGKETTMEHPLLHYLEEGKVSLSNSDGKDVLLVVHPSDYCFEFTFDQEGHVQNLLVYSIWSGLPPEVYSGSVMDTKWLKYAYMYTNYSLVNGYLFPLHVTRTTYSLNDEGKELIEARNNGYMSAQAAELEIRERGLFRESIIDYIDYNKDTLRINEPLEDEVFTIDIPENVRIMKRSEINAANVTESDADKSKWTTGQIITIGIAALISTLVVFGGIFWWYTQTRKIDPVAQ